MPGLLTAVVLALATPTATAAPRLPGNAAAGVSLERIRPRMRRYLGVPAGVLVVDCTITTSFVSMIKSGYRIPNIDHDSGAI